MKNEEFDVDVLLKKALSSYEAPSSELIQKVKYQCIREESVLKKSTIKRSFSTIAVAAISLLFVTTTAFAAWHFLKPSEVAKKFGDQKLSTAFDGETSVDINETCTSGKFTFTLLAIMSGKDITDHQSYSNGDILSDRTYAVVAIAKADGQPMPTTMDEEYGNPSFYVSPYIKGLKPWQVNANTMNGGYSETVVDGIMYRMVECDEVTMFADKGVYLGINTGSFFDSEAFIYNEQTGELKVNPDYDGSSAVFNLPIDKELADTDKAKQYLDSLWDEDETESDETLDGEEGSYSVSIDYPGTEFSTSLDSEGGITISNK
ncbi:MAG: DUF4179 domain-containing protein [Lachnospiraceae bacterium]|nr:DUF4179 domain-containing protein [Lachnospiraceae bacterium]